MIKTMYTLQRISISNLEFSELWVFEGNKLTDDNVYG